MKGRVNYIKETMAILLHALLLHCKTKVKNMLLQSSSFFFPTTPVTTENGTEIANSILNYYYTYFHHSDYLQILNINVYLKIKETLNVFVNMNPSSAPNTLMEY